MKSARIYFIAILLLTSPYSSRFASAQTQSGIGGKWEVEFHGGHATPYNPSTGIANLPGPGAVFVTATGNGSRRVTSWYFGDGALLLNQVQGLVPGAPRISPLDAVLTRSIVEPRSGVDLGFRISRHLNTRFSAEFTLDIAITSASFKSGVVSAVNTTRDDFGSVWTSVGPLWQPAPPFSDLSASSGADIFDGNTLTHLFSTGTLNIDLKRSGHLIPFAAVGGGRGRRTGDTPAVDLTGSYGSTSTSPAVPIGIQDSVKIRTEFTRPVFAVIVGGGLKYYVSPLWGFRFDARAYLSPNRVDTIINTNNLSNGRCFPCLMAPANTLTFGGEPSIQVSTLTAESANPSSLSGPTVQGFRPFRGTGIQRTIVLSFGIFRRF